MKAITFSQALVGYDLATRARRLSEHTRSDYFTTLRKFQVWLNQDKNIKDITAVDIRTFLSLQVTVSDKTLLNYHISLSALWTWALAEGYVTHHVVRDVEPPKAEKTAIVPFSEMDIRALLSAINRSKPHRMKGCLFCQRSLLCPERNEAIILLLLDTGIRASELCELTIPHLDVKNRYIRVFGKGDKERYIPFSPRTGKAIFRYLMFRPSDTIYQNVFMGFDGDPLNRNALLHNMVRIGKRAGVKDCHPHRFRHTFAIFYLRNGGDPYTLQAILGHSSMDMVQTYLKLSQIDFDIKHQLASPVENMHL